MTAVTAGVLLAAMGAVLAFAACCADWWATYLTSRRRMRRELADIQRPGRLVAGWEADIARRTAADPYHLDTEETDQP